MREYRKEIGRKKEEEKRKDLKGSGGELDPDCGFGFQAELVPGESGEEIGLADARVAN